MTNPDVRPLAPDVAERVIERLGLPRIPDPDSAGLNAVYGAFCHRVPFDSVAKRAYFAAGGKGPLPGSTADDFWARWLTHGAGGTCWAGAGALAALLAALGFTVRRSLATMHPGPHAKEPNHATIVVERDDERWLLDASTTTGVPLCLDGRVRPGVIGGAEVRRGDGGETLVFWRPLHSPAGIVFRIDEIGVSEATFAARHEGTRIFSLFNHGLHARLARDGGIVGIAMGMRVALAADGTVRATTLDATTRVRVLVEELGISEEMAARVPADEPVPPPPGMPTERWAQMLATFQAAAPTPS